MGPSLYKYASNENAEKLLRGDVRIGTLYNYRNCEGLDAERADPDEGKLSYVEHQIVPQSGGQLSQFAAQFVPAEFKSAERTLFFGNVFERNQHHRDCFVYCTSHEFSQAAAGRYKACVRITKPNEFFGFITEAWPRDLNVSPDYEISRVQYSERELPGEMEGRLNPAFIKPNRFAPEKEVRVIWLTNNEILRPVYLSVPALAECVELVDGPAK